MSGPYTKAGRDRSGDNPDRAFSTDGCTRAIEQVNRGETCKQTDYRTDTNKSPVVLDRKTSQDPEHFFTRQKRPAIVRAKNLCVVNRLGF